MFNLYQIVTGAQGGQAIDNLAQQFGLSREQADSAVKALVPALSTAFTTKVMQPGGMQEIAGAMTDAQHKQAYTDAGAAQAPDIQQKGNDVAGSIFGDNAIVQQVIQQASHYTGIPAATLQQMLPVIVSMVVGGVATAMHNQGLGGLLGQLANSGFGNILGQFGQAAGQQGGQVGGGQAGGGQAGGGQAGGGLGGMFGNIIGSMLNGGRGGTSEAGQVPGMPPAMQAGMEALGKMFQPGVQPHPGQMGDLGDQISSILGGKPKS